MVTTEILLPGSPEHALVHEQGIFRPGIDGYQHFIGYEGTNSGIVSLAMKIHAEGYYDSNFVNENAIDDNGFLAEGIDKSFGPNTEYRVAINPKNPNDAATMRKIYVPEGGDASQLPAFQLTSSTLTRDGREFLEGIEPQTRLVEIAALAKREGAHPNSVFEIIRNTIHDAIGNNEVWFFSIVANTHGVLAHRMGEANYRVIGEDVAIDDERVFPDVRLRPVVLEPDNFVDNMLNELNDIDDSPRKRKFERCFLYYTAGLGSEKMSPEANEMREKLIARSLGSTGITG